MSGDFSLPEHADSNQRRMPVSPEQCGAGMAGPVDPRAVLDRGSNITGTITPNLCILHETGTLAVVPVARNI